MTTPSHGDFVSEVTGIKIHFFVDSMGRKDFVLTYPERNASDEYDNSYDNNGQGGWSD